MALWPESSRRKDLGDIVDVAVISGFLDSLALQVVRLRRAGFGDDELELIISEEILFEKSLMRFLGFG